MFLMWKSSDFKERKKYCPSNSKFHCLYYSVLKRSEKILEQGGGNQAVCFPDFVSKENQKDTFTLPVMATL